jgi:surface antigen
MRFYAPEMKTELQGFLERSLTGAPRRAALLVTVLVAAFSALGLSAGAASADVYDLCTGYAACSAGSFTTHYYEDSAADSWWRMYPGDNCTNYAAFVESQVYEVPEPDFLLGDGGQWGYRAAEHGVPVNHTPSVGAVAVWDADAPGMGGYGHVGIVEDVAPDGSYIDVSQSGMGTAGDGFDWERIYAAGGSWEPWPDAFIHFAGAAIPGTLPTRPGLHIAGAGLELSGAG